MRHWTIVVGAISVAFSVAKSGAADTRMKMEEQSVVSLPGADAPPAEERNEYTLWLREDRAARVGSGSRIVARLDRGESYLIDDAQKTVNVIELDGLPESMQNVQVEKAGETRTIGSWDAERYDVTLELGPGETGTIVLWISDDVDVDLEAYRAFARSVDPGNGLMTAIANLPGYPVLQEARFGVVEATTRLLEVSEETPPAGTYEVPADYERQD